MEKLKFLTQKTWTLTPFFLTIYERNRVREPPPAAMAENYARTPYGRVISIVIAPASRVTDHYDPMDRADY
ncbi:hypothetical protein NPIL_392851 [Nephila pilipes]|uniref:Uncharacterized protein n=1 Tax=Nephila pilipes TaxID=299642 RepID=A0A8X6UAV6_NEPPI|nr:hypothetical protein NPIL_392851 [Nephila pilipes]